MPGAVWMEHAAYKYCEHVKNLYTPAAESGLHLKPHLLLSCLCLAVLLDTLQHSNNRNCKQADVQHRQSGRGNSLAAESTTIQHALVP